MLAHRPEFEAVFATSPRSIDALDSAPDLNLDHYCQRMRSEVAQGDALSVKAAALSLGREIRVLTYDPKGDAIQVLSYPGTPVTNESEEPPRDRETLQSLEGNVVSGNPHYSSQYGGAGHFNSILPPEENETRDVEVEQILEAGPCTDRDRRGDSSTESAKKPREQVPTPGNEVKGKQLNTGNSEDVLNQSRPQPIRSLFRGAATATSRKRGIRQLHDVLRHKLSSTQRTSLATITKWLSGQNRSKPCRLLASIDTERIQEWIGPQHNLASFIQDCSFIISKISKGNLEFSLRESSPTHDETPLNSLASKTGFVQPQSNPSHRQVVPPPLRGPTRKPLPCPPLGGNPANTSRQESIDRCVYWHSNI